jgi:hypothetical protein
MRFAPETDIFRDCLRSMLQKQPVDPLLRKAKPKIVAAKGVSVCHQLIRVVLKTSGYSRKKVLVYARPTWNEIATAEFLEPAIGIKHRPVGLFFQSMRVPPDEAAGAYIGIGGERTCCM